MIAALMTTQARNSTQKMSINNIALRALHQKHPSTHTHRSSRDIIPMALWVVLTTSFANKSGMRPAENLSCSQLYPTPFASTHPNSSSPWKHRWVPLGRKIPKEVCLGSHEATKAKDKLLQRLVFRHISKACLWPERQTLYPQSRNALSERTQRPRRLKGSKATMMQNGGAQATFLRGFCGNLIAAFPEEQSSIIPWAEGQLS